MTPVNKTIVPFLVTYQVLSYRIYEPRYSALHFDPQGGAGPGQQALQHQQQRERRFGGLVAKTGS